MRRLERTLWLVVAVELILGAFWAIPRLNRPAPVLPDLDSVDPITAKELGELRDRARDGDAGDWRTLAEALLGSGFYAHAEQCFHRAAELDPNDGRSVYGRGFCLERVGRTHESTDVLQQAIALADDDLKQTCRYEIGRNALREEDPRRAEAAFRRLDTFGPARYQLAKLLMRTGRAEEAIAILDHELATAPNSLKFLQLRGWAAQAVGRTEEAARFADRAERAEYQLALEYNSTFIGLFAAQHGFGKLLADCSALQHTGSADQQAHAYGKVLKIIRDNQLWQFDSVFIDAAEVELQRNRPQDALRLLDEREEHGYQSARSLRLRGAALEKLAATRTPATLGTGVLH